MFSGSSSLMAVLFRERFLYSPFLPLMVRTAETQQQSHSGLGPPSLHAQWHPPCTTTNTNKAVGMGDLKRDACCHWKQSKISKSSVWGWAGFWVSLKHWGACGTLYREINSLPQSQDNRDVKGEFINIFHTWGICWNNFLLKSTVLVLEKSQVHSKLVAIQNMRDC